MLAPHIRRSTYNLLDNSVTIGIDVLRDDVLNLAPSFLQRFTQNALTFDICNVCGYACHGGAVSSQLGSATTTYQDSAPLTISTEMDTLPTSGRAVD
jgi:hypothetical protein